MNTHNTFEKPDTVRSAPFKGAKRKGDAWLIELPPKSVVVATVH
jgi:alpha-N-arabinofuranosidase